MPARALWLSLVLLAGCAGKYSDAGLGPVASADFHCPKAGTVTTFTDGGLIRYAGVETDNPAVCKGTFRTGIPFRRAFNFYGTAQNSLFENAKAAMPGLFPTAKGKAAEFVFSGNPLNSSLLSQRYIERWSTAGGENLQVGNQLYRTVVFDREQQGTDGSNMALIHYRLWFAPDPGVWVRMDVDTIRGFTGDRSFAVESIVVP